MARGSTWKCNSLPEQRSALRRDRAFQCPLRGYSEAGRGSGVLQSGVLTVRLSRLGMRPIPRMSGAFSFLRFFLPVVASWNLEGRLEDARTLCMYTFIVTVPLASHLTHRHVDQAWRFLSERFVPLHPSLAIFIRSAGTSPPFWLEIREPLNFASVAAVSSFTLSTSSNSDAPRTWLQHSSLTSGASRAHNSSRSRLHCHRSDAADAVTLEVAAAVEAAHVTQRRGPLDDLSTRNITIWTSIQHYRSPFTPRRLILKPSVAFNSRKDNGRRRRTWRSWPAQIGSSTADQCGLYQKELVLPGAA